jgi:hypothetical protein
MFEMTREELENWRSQFVTSKESCEGMLFQNVGLVILFFAVA